MSKCLRWHADRSTSFLEHLCSWIWQKMTYVFLGPNVSNGPIFKISGMTRPRQLFFSSLDLNSSVVRQILTYTLRACLCCKLSAEKEKFVVDMCKILLLVQSFLIGYVPEESLPRSALLRIFMFSGTGSNCILVVATMTTIFLWILVLTESGLSIAELGPCHVWRLIEGNGDFSFSAGTIAV